MFENLLKSSKFPSPLLLEYENEDASELIQNIALKLFCETQSACKKCRGCKKVLSGFHPDWISIDGSIKMEELRERLRQLKQKPYEAEIRLLTVAQFDLASAFVQNSLLKIFEEPQDHWRLIGVLRSRRRLLPTLRSRCLFLSVKEKGEADSLSPTEKNLFEAIKSADEMKIQTGLEFFLKERQKMRSLCLKFLNEASKQRYPGHWKALAPELEQFALAELERNLHPKIVWEKAWVKSLAAEA